ncbi:MAG: glycoside hydrolase family 16 protein [Parcubacteria group bacterium]|nr:glycoside hydrolase family 16 protein [Parcubacteria group bacterium]
MISFRLPPNMSRNLGLGIGALLFGAIVIWIAVTPVSDLSAQSVGIRPLEELEAEPRSPLPTLDAITLTTDQPVTAGRNPLPSHNATRDKVESVLNQEFSKVSAAITVGEGATRADLPPEIINIANNIEIGCNFVGVMSFILGLLDFLPDISATFLGAGAIIDFSTNDFAQILDDLTGMCAQFRQAEADLLTILTSAHLQNAALTCADEQIRSGGDLNDCSVIVKDAGEYTRNRAFEMTHAELHERALNDLGPVRGESCFREVLEPTLLSVTNQGSADLDTLLFLELCGPKTPILSGNDIDRFFREVINTNPDPFSGFTNLAGQVQERYLTNVEEASHELDSGYKPLLKSEQARIFNPLSFFTPEEEELPEGCAWGCSYINDCPVSCSCVGEACGTSECEAFNPETHPSPSCGGSPPPPPIEIGVSCSTVANLPPEEIPEECFYEFNAPDVIKAPGLAVKQFLDQSSTNFCNTITIANEPSQAQFLDKLVQVVFGFPTLNQWVRHICTQVLDSILDVALPEAPPPGENTDPPTIRSFTATIFEVKNRDTQILLAWDISNADTAEITPEVGVVDPLGRQNLVPFREDITSYTLTASNEFGVVARSATVTSLGLQGPRISFFTAERVNDTTIRLGWQVSGADSLAITPFRGTTALAAMQVTQPSGTKDVPYDPLVTTYRLTASNNAGVNEFATVSNPPPPTPAPGVTTTASPAGGFRDDFNTGSLDSSRWLATNGEVDLGKIANDHQGYLQPDRVSVANGYLVMKLTQEEGQVGSKSKGVISRGSEVRSKATYGYGTYEWRMRMGSTATTATGPGTTVIGGISAAFTFINNSETELDFEVEGQSPNRLEMTTWHTLASKQFDDDPNLTGMSNGFKTYKIVWAPGSVSYYVDDQFKAVHSGDNPSTPAYMMMSHWGTNSTGFGGKATLDTDRYLYVDWVKFTPQ